MVGGALSVSTVSNVGANYTIAPDVFIPTPPLQQANGVGGVPATAHATLANGTVATVVLDNVGAGYTTAPPAVLASAAHCTLQGPCTACAPAPAISIRSTESV